jgi:hypothetical protein
MNRKNNSDAEAVCKSDGGYLVNIDSDQKYESVKAMLIASDFKEDMHIDGKRINSQWKFSYGSTNGYFHWLYGYPSSRADYQCLRLTGNRATAHQRFLTYNWPCSSEVFGIICEIPLYI